MVTGRRQGRRGVAGALIILGLAALGTLIILLDDIRDAFADGFTLVGVFPEAHALEAGTPVRFATLDSYDGSVFGAGSRASTGLSDPGKAFQQAGRRIANPASGTPREVTFTIDGLEVAAPRRECRARGSRVAGARAPRRRGKSA